MTTYDDQFFLRHIEGARRSARAIVPILVDLARPKRVLDVGCGPGTWLAVFREHGVTDVWGIDGPWVDRRLLEIPSERFFVRDLSKPFRLQGQFDLVLSLEVAEHLPPESADGFVDSLTRLGPIILFSAAIPRQGGTGHLNEQWPEYWASLFNRRGYAVIDCIRRRVWNNPDVEWWYAQNALLFVRNDFLQSDEVLRLESERNPSAQLSIVHPRNYLALAEEISRLRESFPKKLLARAARAVQEVRQKLRP